MRGGRRDDVPSGMAVREDIVILGLGGKRDEVDEEGEADLELIDDRLGLDAGGTSGRPFSGGFTAGGSLLERSRDPVRDAT